MKSQQDQHRREVQFDVGDGVWLKLMQRTAASITAARKSKLGPMFFGPYQVVAWVGAVAYKLLLPPKARIHDVFHVSLLKKFEGVPPSETVPLPPILHGRALPTPQKVVRARLNRGTWELLVQWTGLSPAEASWEQLEEFKKSYPSFQLEDELFLGEGGNVVDSFVGRTYQRRRCPNKSG